MIKELLILCLLAVTTHGTSSLQVNLTVVIDGYTVNSTLTSSATLPLGRTALLVCRVSGIPHGQQTNYQWTCTNQPCVQTGYAGRKISNNIIAINTTSTSDGGTYTCTVTAGGMKGRQDFGINVNGGAVAHSYGRLLENDAVITDKRQLQPLNDDTGDGRIECTISGGMSRFSFSPYRVDSGNTQKATAVIPSETFRRFTNFEGSCGNTYLYLFLQKTDGFPQVRSLTPSTDSRQSTITANMEFTYDKNNGIARVITGYHRLDLGHEMVGQFHNNIIKKKLKFSALVPGARYRITAWGLGGGDNKKRGSAPAVLEVTTQPSDPSPPRALTITTFLEDGIELNWLPPRETNGDIQHYIIRYTPQNGTGQCITTTDNINYYNLTGLEGGQTYYNFTVEAANLAHTSAQSNIIGSYTHSPGSLNTPTTKSGTSTATTPTTTSITDNHVLDIGSGAGSLLLVLVVVLAVIICCVVAVYRRGKRSRSTEHTSTLHYYSTPGHEQQEEPQVQIGAANYDTVSEKPASFTPGTLYDEVEVKQVKSKPVAVPSEYQLPLVKADKEDDREAYNAVTIPESFYAQPDTTAKSNKKGEKGTTADVEDPDELYAEVDKQNKKKKGKEKKKEQPQGDLYAVVDKTSKKKGKEKKAKEKEQQGDGDLYAEVDKTQKKGKNDMKEKASFVREQSTKSDSPPPVPEYRMAYEPSADSCISLNNNNNSNNSNSNNSNSNNNNNSAWKNRNAAWAHYNEDGQVTQKTSTEH